MIRYAITDGRSLQGDDIDFVQLRNKAVEAGELVLLARRVIAETGGRVPMLLNSRVDVAVAVGAAGVHLTGHPEELTAEQVRQVYARAGLAEPMISVSCHSMEDVERSYEAGVQMILFGPVFEKRVAGELVTKGVGVEALRVACVTSKGTPVLALGGVTSENSDLCVAAGAAGVAGIRMFGRS